MPFRGVNTALIIQQAPERFCSGQSRQAARWGWNSRTGPPGSNGLKRRTRTPHRETIKGSAPKDV